MKVEGKIIIAISVLLCFILCCSYITRASEKEYEYDDSGRVTKVIYEDGSYETYEYDDNGNITQVNYVNPDIDSSEESKTTEEGGQITTESDDNIQDTDTTDEADTTDETGTTDTITTAVTAEETAGTDDEASITGDRTPVAECIALMLTMLLGMGLVISKKAKEKR